MLWFVVVERLCWMLVGVVVVGSMLVDNAVVDVVACCSTCIVLCGFLYSFHLPNVGWI